MVAATRQVEVALETMLPDLLRAHPAARAVFDRYGLSGCGGRHGPVESVGFFARTHGVDERRLLDELREATSGGSQAAAASDVAAPDRKSTRLNSSHRALSRMPSSA